MLIPGVSQRSPTKTSSHTFPRPCRATRPRIVTTSLNGISHQLLSNPRLLLTGAWARRPAAGYVCWDGGGRRRPPQQKRKSLGGEPHLLNEFRSLSNNRTVGGGSAPRRAPFPRRPAADRAALPRHHP